MRNTSTAAIVYNEAHLEFFVLGLFVCIQLIGANEWYFAFLSIRAHGATRRELPLKRLSISAT